MRHQVAKIALGPILLIQGRRARRRIPRLPEPPGPRAGTVGEGPALRLLIAGDSAAAGVGAASQDEALAGRVLVELAPAFTLDWRLEATTGATTTDTLRRLSGLAPDSFDVLVTSLGVNDVTRDVALDRWLAQQRELRALARARLGVTCMVIAGLPPVDGFPALPQPLRWFLGRRARQFSEALRRELEEERDAHFLDLRFALDPGLMAEDGFHPGPAIYEGWGRRAAAIIRRERVTHHTTSPDRETP